MQEQGVEQLLSCHPYLIDPLFDGIVPQRQVSRGALRLDLAFLTQTGLSIVELKKSTLRPEDVSQLLGYCRSWSRDKATPLASRHYLIGRKPEDTRALDRARRRTKRDIRILFYGEHIPWVLMMVGRRYQPYDESSYSANIVQLKLR